eukprot:TRINITY_DN16326_c0_g1_i1.p1 TRINITY_DN16326_c0_g1~~TRINITY_DN16326_c0_g1_i1.p1  ORF type:complete len:729 (+),score=106.89 TRINITY_DN16326_c0_g1_i1:76-2262(+)
MKYRDRRRIFIAGLVVIVSLVVIMGVSSVGGSGNGRTSETTSNKNIAEYNILRIPKLVADMPVVLVMTYSDWKTNKDVNHLLGSASILIVGSTQEDKIHGLRKAIPEDYGIILQKSDTNNFNPVEVTREYVNIIDVIGTDKPIYIGFTSAYTPKYLLRAVELLHDEDTVLATTCKAVSVDETIVSYGVSPFIISGDTTSLHRNLIGYSDQTRTNSRNPTTDVFLASECLVFRVSDILNHASGGQRGESLSRSLIDIQLQLKTSDKERAYRITAIPEPVVVGDNVGSELLTFDDHYNSDLLHYIHLQRETWIQGAVHQKASLLGVSLSWDVWCDCTGFNIEAIAYLTILDKIVVQTRAIANENCFCRGYPESVQTRLRQLTQPKEFDTVLRDFIPNEEQVSIWVSHKPMEHYPTFPYNGVVTVNTRPDYVVGRSMLEVDAIPSSWVDVLSAESPIIDEVWVPSSFMKQVIINQTPKLKVPIYVVPECIDVSLFDPAATKKLTLPVGDKFVFLANFKWELRKGWQTLLNGYFEEFTAEDNVVLVLKVYLYLDRDPRNEKRIRHKIDEFAKKNGHDPSHLPEIIIVPEEIGMSKMPGVYKAANCFLMPTKGEGWGLPIHEAMSMGLPVIATNWSGITEFATNSTSLLIPINGTEPVSGSGFPKGSKWAVPSLPEFKRLMRWVFSNPKEAAKLGTRAREHIVAHYSQEAVAPIIARRLVDIKKTVLERGYSE